VSQILSSIQYKSCYHIPIIAYKTYSFFNQIIIKSSSLNNFNQYKNFIPYSLFSLIIKLHQLHHLESISIHATSLILHNAYNSSNSHQSYRSYKLLNNQLNEYNSSFQKYRQGNHHHQRNHQTKYICFTLHFHHQIIIIKSNHQVYKQSPNDKHHHVHISTYNHIIHQITSSQNSYACDALDTTLHACGTNKYLDIKGNITK
jgi:hypothetical protein